MYWLYPVQYVSHFANKGIRRERLLQKWHPRFEHAVMDDGVVRVRGLRPNEAAALLASPAPLELRMGKSEKGWLAVTLVGGIAVPLVAALIIGGVLYLRRRKTSAVIPFNALLPIACPGCGKNLKVKPDLAGKKVRCGQCGKAVLVAGRKDA